MDIVYRILVSHFLVRTLQTHSNSEMEFSISRPQADADEGHRK
jgi:hypothetical protein